MLSREPSLLLWDRQINPHFAADRSKHFYYEDQPATRAEFGQKEQRGGATHSGSQAGAAREEMHSG